MSDWLAAAVVVIVVGMLCFVWGLSVVGNDNLQKDYNRSLVACVATGKPALDCRVALLPGNN